MPPAFLVMATLTLGLMFSGWLTPTPIQAQGQGGGNPTNNAGVMDVPGSPYWQIHPNPYPAP